MTDITPAERLEATLSVYDIFGAACVCSRCFAQQSVTECRQPFPHRAGCALEAAETHPWILINTAVDWAMRRADPVPAAQPATTSGAST
ncbi:hypothetical protein [Zavarzinia aquatilis]|uniref:Uncharacterized protein n=1 Tax=Zavarzinia aquatilis TaxID=2211142 RepID=A0A317DTL2_9PROT|nr:hypothetical protein [Zavarzinia aquatilis]PWR17704.1 hypothetical protein DKG74_20670 [Zavarzinia aquatilis]